MTDPLDRLDQPQTSPAGAGGAVPPSLVDRIVKVFVAPTAAMREVAERPAWLFPMLIICVVVWLYTATSMHILMPEQFERQLPHASDSQIEAIEQQLDLFSEPPIWLRVLTGLGSGLSATLFAILVPGMLLHLFLRLSEGEGTMRQTLGVVGWAGLIAYGLRSLLSWIIVVVTGTGTYAGLTAAAFMPDADPSSLQYVAANLYGDPFVYWMLWVILIGIVRVHQLAPSRAVVVIAATYVLLSAVPLGFTLLGQAIGAR